MSIPTTSKGGQRIQVDPPEGSRVDVISPNWCDPTTWFDSAGAVTEETLTDSGDGLTFESTHENWIDSTHGKLTDEDDLDDTFIPVITANGVEQTPDAPFGGDQEDYSIDYEAGTVTFHSAPTGPIVADYRYEDGSEWVIAPLAGKNLRLTAVEVQFSRNVDLKDAVIFQAYGLVDVFAPDLMPGVPSGTKIPIGDPTVYKTLMDYINAASGAFAEIPAMGGSTRGMAQAIQIFQWPYDRRASTDLLSAAGMEVRIKLQDDTPFIGEHAIATFYGISEGAQ